MKQFTINKMKTSETGLNIIKYFEGCEPQPYYCSAHVLTVGYGHAILKGELEYFQNLNRDLTDQEMTNLLARDVGFAEAAIRRYVKVSLTQNQFDALVSFIFNLGAGAFRSSTLLRVINRGEYENAPAQFRRWVRAGGRKLQGLVRRRESEIKLWEADYEIKGVE